MANRLISIDGLICVIRCARLSTNLTVVKDVEDLEDVETLSVEGHFR